MSSKKQLRRERQEKLKEEKGRRGNPVRIFLLSLVAALVVLGLAAFALRPDRGEPPWEGAVWSTLHGHWH